MQVSSGQKKPPGWGREVRKVQPVAAAYGQARTTPPEAI
jgi:hypothetical protein